MISKYHFHSFCMQYEEENQKLRGKEVKSVSADVPCNNDAKIEQE